jgi:hypothetical protein
MLPGRSLTALHFELRAYGMAPDPCMSRARPLALLQTQPRKLCSGGKRACTAARVAPSQSFGSAVTVMLATHVPSRPLSAISTSMLENCASPLM